MLSNELSSYLLTLLFVLNFRWLPPEMFPVGASLRDISFFLSFPGYSSLPAVLAPN